MWTLPTCGPHCGNLSSDLQTPIQPRSNMLSLDMFGTELRLTETLRTGKDHYSMWRWQCQCHCYIQCPGIIYHLSSILMRSFQPSSVGQPTSSLVPFSLFSTLVLSGKKSKANSYKNKHYIIWTMKCLRTPLINLEDVFLTGLCANKELGLKLSNNKVWLQSCTTSLLRYSVNKHSSNLYHEDQQQWLTGMFVFSRMQWQFTINTPRKCLTICGVG